MLDRNRHKLLLIQILKDIYSDVELATLLDRNVLTNRDIFDCWFFMQKRTPINTELVEDRMRMPYADYIERCISELEAMSDRGLLQGLGELMDADIKTFVKTKLRNETITLFRFYKDYPIPG